MENFLQHPSIPHKTISKTEQKHSASHQLQQVGWYVASQSQCTSASGVELSRATVSWPGHRSRQSLCSCLHLMSPHLTEQSLPIHWCSGSSPLVLLNACWPRPEVPVGFIYLSCGLSQLEKSTGMQTSVHQACKVGQC